MDLLENQLRCCYENESRSPEEIAEAFDLDVATVELVLARSSSKFRKSKKKDVGFSYDIGMRATEVLAELMEHPDALVRLKASQAVLRDIREECPPTIRDAQNVTVNVLTINEAISSAMKSLRVDRKQLTT